VTQDRRGLFGEGARLPEELSRLLFLEPVIHGRRVLEVGARSDAVARFLVELGAARVVCASDDRILVETLRAENDLESVDFRAIRPGVLPGDDGAFDLVIDFGLPEALTAGVTYRLTDLGRLLSVDGFAITALKSASARGLSTLLGTDGAPALVAQPSSAAGLAQHQGAVTYGGLVEALKLQFELVQVYFQSLLLGYLFGSFDAARTDDGVSPHTALMGDTPEPAGHYLFAFGRAVPVIEDVALVQVPISDVLALLAAAPVTAPGAVERVVAPPPVRSEADDVLVAELERRTAERDEIAVFLESSDAAVTARDALIASLRTELDTAIARTRELAEAACAGSSLAASATRLVAEHDNLKQERRDVVDVVAALEGDKITLENRARLLEEAHQLSILRVHELESALLALEQQRAQLTEDLARGAAASLDDTERVQILQARVAILEESLAQSVEQSLEETPSERRESEAGSQEAQRAALLEERARELESLVEKRTSEGEERNRQISALMSRVAQLEREVEVLRRRRDELEADAHRLADGVKTLVREREEHRALALQHKARADELSSVEHDLAETRARTAELSSRIVEVTERGEGAERKLRAAHAALEEARRELSAARAGLPEIAGQRDTLNQVVSARDRELFDTKDELLQATGELSRLQEQLGAQHKALAAARERIAAVEVDKATQKRREDELGRAHQEATKALVLANDQLAVAHTELAGTKDQLGHVRAQLAAAAQAEEAHVAAEWGLGVELEETQRKALLERERERAATELLRAALLDGRSALEGERAAFLSLQASLVEARSLLDVERARGDLFAEELGEAHDALSTERARGDLFSSALDEATAALAHARARGDLFASQLDEATLTLERERARGDLKDAVLVETQLSLASHKTLADLLGAHLVEAQGASVAATTSAALLSAELEEARTTFRRRRAGYETGIENERARAAAAVNDGKRSSVRIAQLEEQLVRANAARESARDALGAAEGERAQLEHALASARSRAAQAEDSLRRTEDAINKTASDAEERLRAAGRAATEIELELKEANKRLSEQQGDDALLHAERERLMAVAESAERECLALRDEVGAHQERAAAEAAARRLLEAELAELRRAPNGGASDAERLGQGSVAEHAMPDMNSAGRSSAQEIVVLRERIEALMKGARIRDAKIAEQADRINRLTERLVRDAGLR
jgi:chromosome segregation ATPase